MSERDGGPAYPLAFNTAAKVGMGGMSLRDHFAAQALTGVLMTAPKNAPPVACAMWAYSVADAMLAERAK